MDLSKKILESDQKENDELLNQRVNSKRKSMRLKRTSFRPKSLKAYDRVDRDGISFGDYQSDFEKKSLDTLMRDYRTNPYFRIKINMLIAEAEKDSHALDMYQPIKYEKVEVETLKGNIKKSRQAFLLKLMELKKRIEEENEKKKEM